MVQYVPCYIFRVPIVPQNPVVPLRFGTIKLYQGTEQVQFHIHIFLVLLSRKTCLSSPLTTFQVSQKCYKIKLYIGQSQGVGRLQYLGKGYLLIFNICTYLILTIIPNLCLNVSPTVIDWFHSCLHGRRQRIRIDAHSGAIISAGAPQGGVLSPLSQFS